VTVWTDVTGVGVHVSDELDDGDDDEGAAEVVGGVLVVDGVESYVIRQHSSLG